MATRRTLKSILGLDPLADTGGIPPPKMMPGDSMFAQAFNYLEERDYRGRVDEAYARAKAKDDAQKQAEAAAKEANRQRIAQEKEARRARNTATEERAVRTGAKTWTDAFGEMHFAKDEQGRQLFTEDTGPVEYDEKTGRAFQVKRDQYGRKTVVDLDKDAPIGTTPEAPGIYRKNKFREWDYLSDADTAARSADPKLRKAGLEAIERRDKELLGRVSKAADAVAFDSKERLARAQIRRQEIDAETAALSKQNEELSALPETGETEGGFLGIGKRPTAKAKPNLDTIAANSARMQELATEAFELDSQIEKIGGEVKQSKAEMDAIKTGVRAKGYQTARDLRVAKLRASGKDDDAIASDPIISSIDRAVRELGVPESPQYREEQRLGGIEEASKQAVIRGDETPTPESINQLAERHSKDAETINADIGEMDAEIERLQNEGDAAGASELIEQRNLAARQFNERAAKIRGMASGMKGLADKPFGGAIPLGEKKGGVIAQLRLGTEEGFKGLGKAGWGAMDTLYEFERHIPILGKLYDALGVGQKLTDIREFAAAEANGVARIRQATEGPKFVGTVASGAMSIIPTLAVAPLGFGAVVTAAGLQSVGSTFSDATDAGKTKGKADRDARNAAIVPAIASGVSTALWTYLGGRTGPEAAAMLLRDKAAGGVIRNAIKKVLGATLGTFTVNSLGEGLEESVDGFFQGVIAKFSYDPEKTWSEIFSDVIEQGLVGTLLGGAFAGIEVHETRRQRKVKEKSESEELAKRGAILDAYSRPGIPERWHGDVGPNALQTTAAIRSEAEQATAKLDAIAKQRDDLRAKEQAEGLTEDELIQLADLDERVEAQGAIVDSLNHSLRVQDSLILANPVEVQAARDALSDAQKRRQDALKAHEVAAKAGDKKAAQEATEALKQAIGDGSAALAVLHDGTGARVAALNEIESIDDPVERKVAFAMAKAGSGAPLTADDVAVLTNPTEKGGDAPAFDHNGTLVIRDVARQWLAQPDKAPNAAALIKNSEKDMVRALNAAPREGSTPAGQEKQQAPTPPGQAAPRSAPPPAGVSTQTETQGGPRKAVKWAKNPPSGPFKTFAPSLEPERRATVENLLARLPTDAAKIATLQNQKVDPREFGFWTEEQVAAEEKANQAPVKKETPSKPKTSAVQESKTAKPVKKAESATSTVAKPTTVEKATTSDKKNPPQPTPEVTPEEKKPEGMGVVEWSFRKSTKQRIAEKKDFKAQPAEDYGFEIPPGYVREGDRYVFKGEGAAPAKTAEPTKAKSPESNAPANIVTQAVASIEKLTSQKLTPEQQARVAAVIARIQKAANPYLPIFKAIGVTPEPLGSGGVSMLGGVLQVRVADLFTSPNESGEGRHLDFDNPTLVAIENTPYRVTSLIVEEAIHAIALKTVSMDEAADIWRQLPESVRRDVKAAYVREGSTDGQLGHEFLRMVAQGKVFGAITEQTDRTLAKRIADVFRRIVEFAKDIEARFRKSGMKPEFITRIKQVTDHAAEVVARLEKVASQNEVATSPPPPVSPPAETAQKSETPKPRRIGFSPPVSERFREMPVISAILNHGGIVSKGAFRKKQMAKGVAGRKGKEADAKVKANSSMWDGAPTKQSPLAHPTHNQIFKSTGLMPDQMAQALFDEGAIPEATPDAMWSAISKASRDAKANIVAPTDEGAIDQGYEAHAKERIEQRQNLDEATKAGPVRVNPQELTEGSTLDIEGETVTVESVQMDDDGNVISVTLKDGSRFGLQTIDGGKLIYVEGADIKPMADFDPDVLSSADLFSLESITPQQVKAEEAAKIEKEKKNKQRQQMLEKANAPLVGDSSDVGQGDFFKDDLFGGKALLSAPAISDHFAKIAKTDPKKADAAMRAATRPDPLISVGLTGNLNSGGADNYASGRRAIYFVDGLVRGKFDPETAHDELGKSFWEMVGQESRGHIKELAGDDILLYQDQVSDDDARQWLSAAIRDTMMMQESGRIPKGKDAIVVRASQAFRTWLNRIQKELAPLATDNMRAANVRKWYRQEGLASAPITPEQDAAYLDAVGRDDLETAQRMVDEAARGAGYSRTVFHGTGLTKFDVFRDWLPNFFTEDKEYASGYVGGKKTKTGRILKLYVSVARPLDTRIETHRNIFNNEFLPWVKEKGFQKDRFGDGAELKDGELIPFTKADVVYPFLRSRARAGKQDFDGYLVDERLGNYPPSIVPLLPSQIKSADPITRDSKGNVIPLSQRFDASKDSILFSAPHISEPATPDAIRQMLGDIDADIAQDEADREKALAKRQAGDLEANPEISRIDRSLKRLRKRRAQLIAQLPDGDHDNQQLQTPSEVEDGQRVPGMGEGNRVQAREDQPTDPQRAPQPPLDITDKDRSTISGAFTHDPAPAQWMSHILEWINGFKGTIPEIPVLGKLADKYRRLHIGLRDLRSATVAARTDAGRAIKHVIQPLMDLNIRPEQGLTSKLKAVDDRIREARLAGKPVPQSLLDESAAIIAKMNANPYHLFRRAVLYRDLWYRGNIDTGRKDPGGNPVMVMLPNGLTVEETEAILKDVHDAIANHESREAIEEALRRHYQLVSDVREDLIGRGYVITEEMVNPFYFPHTVLDKWNGYMPRTAIDTAEPFRGYLVRLVGTEGNIETDYLTAMYKHLTEVRVHNLGMDAVELHWRKPYDIFQRLRAQADAEAARNGRRAGPNEWRRLMSQYPDYEIVNPDHRLPLRPEAIIDRKELENRLGVRFMEGDIVRQLQEMGITLTAGDLEHALAAGNPTPWVVPKIVARAIRNTIARESLEAPRSAHNPGGRKDNLWDILMRGWKFWKLHSPTSAFRYNWNNVVTDLEKIVTVDPKVFTYFPRAFKDVRAWMKDGSGGPDVQAAARHDVFSTVTASEVSRLPEMPVFREFRDTGDAVKTIASRAIFWSKDFANFREAVFRYAKFLADLERIRGGKVPVYGGAFWKNVEAEVTDEAKAAHIARETFVDYQAISVSGEYLRRKVAFFYSWIEGNWRYHINLFRNGLDMASPANMETRLGTLARLGAVMPSKILLPRSIRGFALRMGMLQALVWAWNAYQREKYDIRDTDISDEDRRRFHLIVGKKADGKPELIYASTAINDLVRWFGGNEFVRLVGDVTAGRMDFKDAAHQWARHMPKDFINNVAGSIRPELRAGIAFFTRQNTWPDITNPRPISAKDMRRFILAQITDDFTANHIEHLFNKDFYDPRDYGEWLKQIVLQVRQRDPDQWAYYGIRDLAEEFMESKGVVEGGGYKENPDAQLIRSFRSAINEGDVAAAAKFYGRLVEGGYSQKRFEATLRNMDPLDAIPKAKDGGKLRREFLASLSKHERDMLNRSFRYFARVRGAEPPKLFGSGAPRKISEAEARAVVSADIARRRAEGAVRDTVGRGLFRRATGGRDPLDMEGIEQ